MNWATNNTPVPCVMTAPDGKKSRAGITMGGFAEATAAASPRVLLGGQAQLVRRRRGEGGGEPAAADAAAPAPAAHGPVCGARWRRRQEVQGGHEALARRLVLKRIAHKDISLVNPLPNSANFWALREPSCLDLPLLKHGLMASCPSDP